MTSSATGPHPVLSRQRRRCPTPPTSPTRVPGSGRSGWTDMLATELRRTGRAAPPRARPPRAGPIGVGHQRADPANACSADGIEAELLPIGTGVVAEIGSGGTGGRAARGHRRAADPRGDRPAVRLDAAGRLARLRSRRAPDGAARRGPGAGRAGDLAGRVRLIFQPAEEVFPGGSHDVIAAGALDGLRTVFALHCDPRLPVGQVGLKVGRDHLHVRRDRPAAVRAGRAHLAAAPDDGPGVRDGHGDHRAARRCSPAGSTRGRRPCWCGASRRPVARPNAIPRDGVLRGTLRMMDRAVLGPRRAAGARADRGAARADRRGYELTYSRGVPPVDNDVAATDVHAGRGPARARRRVASVPAEQSTGAEDFAVFLEHVPGALARLGVWDGVSPRVDLHSSTFVVDERAVAAGIRLMTHTALAALHS